MKSDPPRTEGGPGDGLRVRLERHITAAEEAIRKKDWTTARAEVESAIRIDPTQHRAFELQAQIEQAVPSAEQAARGKRRRRTRQSAASGVAQPAADAASATAANREAPSPKSRLGFIVGVAPAVIVFMIGVSRLGSATPTPVATPGNSGCSPTIIASGQAVSGSLTDEDCSPTSRSGKADAYTFQSVGGDSVTITMSGSFDTYLSLTGPAGDILEENDDADGTNSRIQVSLPTAGTYTIEARSYDDSLGSYTLTMSGATAPAPAAAVPSAALASPCLPASIRFGTAVTGSLTDGDCAALRRDGSKGDNYTFLGAAGQNVTIEMAASFDTFLFLVGPDGDLVAENDDADGSNSRIQAGLSSSGTYRVEAVGYDGSSRGAYSLTLTGGRDASAVTVAPRPSAPPCSTAGIVAGQSVTGTLTDGDCAVPRRSESKADRYTFQGNAGQSMTITMRASFDTYLFLVDPSGNVVSENDDADGTNSQTQVRLPNSGTYTIEATGYDGNARGAYTLTVTSNTAPGTVAGGATPTCSPTGIGLGRPITGSLTDGDCAATRRRGSKADQYTFQGNSGQSVTITMTASFDTYLFLVGPTGSVLADNDDANGTNSRVQLQLPSAGTYTIEAVGFDSGARGSYSLTLTGSAAPAAPPVLQQPPPPPAFGTLTAISVANGNCTVSIDGGQRRNLPLTTPIRLSAGGHVFMFSCTRGDTWEERYEVQADRSAPISTQQPSLQRK